MDGGGSFSNSGGNTFNIFADKVANLLTSFIFLCALLGVIFSLNRNAESSHDAGYALAKAEDAKSEVRSRVDADAQESRLVLQALIRVEAKIDAQRKGPDK